jgi:hypothetical protein
VHNCGINRHAYVSVCGVKSHALEEKLKGAKNYPFGEFGIFMGCDG